MSFKRWILGLLGTSGRDAATTVDAETPASSMADALEEEAAGLNFKSAIEAHQKWKARLRAVVDGTSTESLNVAVVSRDDQCVLGKWIHGSGGMSFGQSDEFARLRENHARFHRCAGHVLTLAQSNQREAANTALADGEYANASKDVVLDLARMYTKATQ